MTKRKRAAPAPAARRFLRYVTVQMMLGYDTRSGLWRAVRRGDVPPPIRSGSMVRWDEEELLRFLASRRAADHGPEAA